MKRKLSHDHIGNAQMKMESKNSVEFSKNIENKKTERGLELSVKKSKTNKFEKPTKTKTSEKSTKLNAVEPKKALRKDNLKDDKKKMVGIVANRDKPNWLEFKKEKKMLKEQRKAKKLATVYEPSLEAKLVGEKLRRADCKPKERVKLTNKLYDLLKGNLNKAVFTHDLSRVVQWLLKFGNEEIRKNVMDELKPSVLAMFQSKYAKNCLKNAMKYGNNEIHKHIVGECYGNVVKLVSHSVSSPLIDYVYNNYASDLNKLHFRQEFYGDMYKQAKDDKIKTISDVYASAVDMKTATLSAIKMNLVRVLNKNLVSSCIVQTVLVDYLKVCTTEDRAELISMLRSSIIILSQSEIGAKLAMTCIWYGTNKDRKILLKGLKQHVKDICISEHGHMVVMAIFDSVDDTVLVKKLILAEILVDLVDIASNEYGRKVILHLVARHDTAYFHPTLVHYLKQGDDNETSKKSSEVRENELIEAVIEPFLDSITENITLWLANSSIALVTLAILKRGHGDKLNGAFEAIAGFITNNDSRIKEETGVERVAVEHSGLHMILKKLLAVDKTFGVGNFSTFGQVLEEKLNEQIIERWIYFNRGCFLLVFLIENSPQSTVISLKTKLKPVIQTLKMQKSPGASILLKKIK
ncbi:pumilio homolog 3 [Venturia canescens]|uniref:pumilio homolog 3 n=1 Tax=Venturia canescens TaxID=32260 RepID=UPI001C9CB25B|nr:pumilio homolog 3 [Venturia canescens]